MDEPFIISLVYNNTSRDFEAQLFTSRYSYLIQVLVDEVAVNFERDDEGNFRALSAAPADNRIEKLDSGLLRAIAGKIEEILA